jgi:bifunctional N-acetylglucosamine-1-phosphate-uridyltransferase/glucosamine-1-phosphate-acetyltransferase GlmU-like protein
VAADPANDAPYRLINNVEFGEGVIVFSFTNLYGCRIGDHTRIGSFVEIQRGAFTESALSVPDPCDRPVNVATGGIEQ